jgi:hypothetical protein
MTDNNVVHGLAAPVQNQQAVRYVGLPDGSAAHVENRQFAHPAVPQREPLLRRPGPAGAGTPLNALVRIY